MAEKKESVSWSQCVLPICAGCLVIGLAVRAYQPGSSQGDVVDKPIVVEPPPEAVAPAGVAEIEPEKPATSLASVTVPAPVAVGEPKPVPKIEPKPVALPADPVPAKPAPVAKHPVDSVDSVSGFHASEPTVIMLSTPGCAPCKMWAAAKAPLLAKEKVKYFSVDDVPQPSYPAFRIYDGKGRWHGKTGSRTTIAEIMALIKG